MTETAEDDDESDDEDDCGTLPKAARSSLPAVYRNGLAVSDAGAI